MPESNKKKVMSQSSDLNLIEMLKSLFIFPNSPILLKYSNWASMSESKFFQCSANNSLSVIKNICLQ